MAAGGRFQKAWSLGLAGKKKTVKPGARLAARKRAGAKAVQAKSAPPKSAPAKSAPAKSVRPKSGDAPQAENVRLAAELRAALDRQAATSEILRVISQSPTDVQPVFDAIVLTAARLFRRDMAFMLSCDATAYWPVATSRPEGVTATPQITRVAIDTGTNFPSRVIATGKNLHVPDWSAVELPEYERMVHQTLGINSALYLPLLRKGKCIGVLGIAGRRAGVFGESEIALAESFRDQALIAIENARLFNETKDALERQTATADILKVIASSPSDVQPVFEAIASSANRLVDALSTTVFRLEEGVMHLRAFTTTNPEADATLNTMFPAPLSNFSWGEAISKGGIYRVVDTDQEIGGMRELARLRGYRSMLFVPLLRDGMPIGLIAVTRVEPGPFVEHHVQLLQTFADQAVIAIENTRLFNETKEALERQTATADILKVIASSPSDVQPVFEAIATSANRLIGGFSGTVWRIIDGALHLVAFTPTTADADEILKASFPAPVANFPLLEVVYEGKIAQVVDTEAILDVRLMEIARARGFRSVIWTPLLSNGAPIGVIGVTRLQPGSFAAHHVQLLRTFADQAVIAIENVRLFDEVQARTRDLTESLQQQTATADVLKVISRSAFDLQAVFDTLLSSAVTLSGGFGGTICVRDGDAFPYRASVGASPEFAQFLAEHPATPGRHSTTARVILTGEVVNIPDILQDSEYRMPDPGNNTRSSLGVPLLRNDKIEGALVLVRREPGPFAPQQVELVKTFADQAVIAIENVRLFDEVQARTRDLMEALTYQTGSGNILKVIASSPTDVGPVLRAIVENACELCEADDAVVHLRDGDELYYGAHHGTIPVGFERRQINRNWVTGRSVIDKVPIYLHDVLAAEGDEFPEARAMSRRVGARTILSVPLLRANESIGAIVLRRSEVNPFSEKQIALLQTFADQAVIAIGNVRLFDEVQAKTRDLSEALVYQTGSGNILKVIASSPTDVEPVLNAIVESACELCDAVDALVLLKDDDNLHHGAHYGPIPYAQAKWTISRNWVAARSVIDKVPIHVLDVLSAEGDEFPDTRERARRNGSRTFLSVPLLREGKSIGAIVLRRTEVQPFSDKQIALLQTFADQAVIAIGNVRLFDEVQAKTRDLTESLQQQTATADVLKVISASPGELEPVFQAMLANAVHLCGAEFAMLFLYEKNEFRAVGKWNLPTAYSEFLGKNKISADPRIPLGRAAITKQPVQVADILVDQSYIEGHPGIVAVAEDGGARTLLQVPMLKDNELVGTVGIYRQEVKPFTDKQIALVQNFAAQAVIAIENARLLNELRQRTGDLTASLEDLRTAQDRLVQTEKLASLGQLTAGIAHEIKNPLNFVNNFSALSAELVDELNDALKPATLNDKTRKEVDDLTQMLKGNLEKVVQHGKRADSIVKNMLLHSREGSGEHRPADINALLDESLNLAYHGARAEKSEFNITLRRDFDARAGMVELFPQEITRALLNLISNGFYAAAKRKAEAGHPGFEPVLSATTRNLGDRVEIRIRDNGTGIPAEVKEKMFNPFFTTKPAGEGTGLGLSMSHDIIVKQHGGTVDVETAPGQFTEFRIVLPRTSSVQEKKRGQS
jgi:GAF domain-containing protein